jgi:uncharacterized protein with von Willebrand factor type A (vWA) domain
VADAAQIVAGFAGALRAAGVQVPTACVVSYARALGLVGLERREHVYWAGRATLVCRQDDVAAYDRVFSQWWLQSPAVEGPSPHAEVPLTLLMDSEEAGDPASAGTDERTSNTLALRWSPTETLAGADLTALTEEEWAEAQRLISALKVTAESRPSRRTRPLRRQRSGGSVRPDLRLTVRASLATGGAPLRRAWRFRISRPRRMVFLLDVSGSMEPYARALVRFAHAAVRARRAGRVEVFTFGTRLTRITRELSRHDPDAALAAAGAVVDDWAGGTRLGDSLRDFLDGWGARGIARGSVVVIYSDGWDRGDPTVVSEQMARLSRVARRVVWVNPLKASPGYAPLAQGMAAALPYVDQFVEGHSVASLEALAEVIGGGTR